MGQQQQRVELELEAFPGMVVMAQMSMNSDLAAEILAEWLENGNFPERRLAH